MQEGKGTEEKINVYYKKHISEGICVTQYIEINLTYNRFAVS